MWGCTVPKTEVIFKTNALYVSATAFRPPKCHNISKGNKEGKQGQEKTKTVMRIRSRKGREKSFSVDINSFHI